MLQFIENLIEKQHYKTVLFVMKEHLFCSNQICTSQILCVLILIFFKQLNIRKLIKVSTVKVGKIARVVRYISRKLITFTFMDQYFVQGPENQNWLFQKTFLFPLFLESAGRPPLLLCDTISLYFLLTASSTIQYLFTHNPTRERE